MIAVKAGYLVFINFSLKKIFFLNKRLTVIIDSAVAGGDQLKLHILCTSLGL